MPPHFASVVSDCDERSKSTDDNALVEAREVLRSSGYLALTALECGAESGVLELRGTVGSYYLKQLAQAMVLRMQNIREVKNLIEVQSVGEGYR
jgi:hypothetical protein